MLITKLSAKFGQSVGLGLDSSGCVLYNEDIPITEQEAKEWVEMHLDADTYVELFGEPEE